MHRIVLSFSFAAVLVGSYFYLSFLQVNAYGTFQAAALNSASVQENVQEVIFEHVAHEEGSAFTPLWTTERYVEVAPNGADVAESDAEVSTSAKEQSTKENETVVQEKSAPKTVAAFPHAQTPETEVIETFEEPEQVAATVVVEEESDVRIPNEMFSELVEEIHALTNSERKHEGLHTLEQDVRLASIAQHHSDDMVVRNFLDHVNPDGCGLTCRFKATEYPAVAWAENIALLRKSHLLPQKQLAKEIFESWMSSGEHRRNILNEVYTREGIGVSRDGDTLYVTVEFAQPR